MQGIEAFDKYIVESQKGRRIISPEESIHKRETILIIKYIKIAQDILIVDVCTAEGNRLIEYGKGITHSSVSLMSDHMQRLIIYRHSLILSHHAQIQHNILDSDPVEVICLATRKNRRQDLMFFRSGENEYGMCRRFLQSLEKSIEGGLREHVHLVDDIDAIPAYLRRDTDLIHKGLDVFHSVVGSRIKFMYAI